MAKFKERESNENSQLVIYIDSYVLHFTFMLWIYPSFYAIEYHKKVLFNSSDLTHKGTAHLKVIDIASLQFIRLFFVVLSSRLFSSKFHIPRREKHLSAMAKNDNNKTGDNDNNENDKNQNKTKTTTNDEDEKKREQRRKRFAATAFLDTDADTNIGGLFGEDVARLPHPSASSSSSSAAASKAAPHPSPQVTEEPMDQDDDDDDDELGTGPSFDRDTPINDAILESDADDKSAGPSSSSKAKDSRKKPPPRSSPKHTIRQYVTAEEGEITKALVPTGGLPRQRMERRL